MKRGTAGVAGSSGPGRQLRLKRVIWATVSLAAVMGVGAQTSAPSPTASTPTAPASPPTPANAAATSAPGNSTRAELLESLRRIDAQLATLTDAARPEDRGRLLELKAQFEVLILQAELEALRQENTSLQAQRRQTQEQARSGQGGAQASGGAQSSASQRGGVSPLEAEMSTMRRQFSRLAEQQKNVTAQLSTIERQHALLLEELANVTAGTPTPPPSAQAAPPELQAELADLRDRFSQLDAQQGTINRQLGTITEQHAELLDQLGATPNASQSSVISNSATSSSATLNSATSSATPQTYVVQPGDSLSKISKALYGTGARWPEILAANPTLQDPDQLFSGTVLTVP